MSFETECFSMNSDISKRTNDFSEPNKNSASRRATSVFADASWPKEEEAADRAQRRFEASAAAANRARQGGDGFVLADDALVQLRLDAQKFLLFVFFNRGDADAGPARDHFLDILAGNDSRRSIIQFVAFAKGAQVFFFFALFLGIKPSLFEFVIGDGRFHAVGDELYALLDFADFFRDGGLAQFYARAGFVDQVDGLVRKKTVGNIAVRKINGIAQRFIGVADSMKLFVAFAHALDDLNGFFFIGGGNFYGLEAPFERAVFFHRFSVFARRCRADALNLSARKSRLQNVRGIQRTFRGARSHQRVQFVDENDRVLALHQFFHDGFEALFELAAVFCSSNDKRKIQRKDALVRQERRERHHRKCVAPVLRRWPSYRRRALR